MPDAIPETLRKQLSKAGKTAIKKHGREFFVNAGKKGWLARLERARQKAEQLEKK